MNNNNFNPNNNNNTFHPSSSHTSTPNQTDLELLLGLNGGSHQPMQHQMQIPIQTNQMQNNQMQANQNTPLWVDGNMAQSSQFGLRGPAALNINNLTSLQQQQLLFNMQQQQRAQQQQQQQQQQQSGHQNNNIAFRQMLQGFPEQVRDRVYELVQELEKGNINQNEFHMGCQQLLQQQQQRTFPNNNTNNLSANANSGSMLGGSTLARSAGKPNTAAAAGNNKRGGAGSMQHSSSSNASDPLQHQQPPMKRMRNDAKPGIQQQSKQGGKTAATSGAGNASFSVPTAAPPRSQTTPSGNQDVELGIEDMMDVTNYGGVDLRQEEFSMNDMGGSGTSAQQYSSAVEQPFLNSHKVREFVMSHQTQQYGGLAGISSAGFIEEIDDQFLSFMDSACQLYMTQLIESMVAVSEARMTVDYNIFKDTVGQVHGGVELDVEERGDDIRGFLVEMEQREGVEMNGLIGSVGYKPEPEEEEEEAKAGAGGGDVSVSTSATGEGGGSKKKGSGSGIKKDLPEAMKNQLTNYAAMMAVGGTVKSWMLPGGSVVAAGPGAGGVAGAKGPPLPSAMRRPAPPSSFQDFSGTSGGGGGTLSTRTGGRGGNRVIQKRVTIKDALTVLEGQKHLKSSELLYRWLANIK